MAKQQPASEQSEQPAAHAHARPGNVETARSIHRHRWPVRLMHWINLLCMTILLMSGLQIFNAHPALYWGHDSNFDHPWLSIGAERGGDGTLHGVTRIGSASIPTTGVLGVSGGSDGRAPSQRAFPTWATIPGPQWLSMGRQWHFFFAWLLVINGVFYVLYSLMARHLDKDLLPHRRQLRTLGHTFWQHLRLRFPKGEEAREYNVLQKLTYLAVIFLLGPLIVLTGLTMSPWVDSALPQLLWLFGGRQSARAIHFLCAFSFLAFVLVHVAMVVLSGTWNNLRSMITGRYVLERPPAADEERDDD
ncbi:MAG: cytochrome b/b6 domain-containing protein [Rhodanobacteraceae bacterium]